MTRLGLSSALGFGLALMTTVGFITACSPESPKLVPLPEAKPERVRDTSGIKVSFNRSVDILFVIDDSGSMSGHQFNLAKNIGLFTAGINANQVLDYHIGVLTSNMDSSPWRPAPGYGWKGELNGTTKFITKKTPNASRELEANLKPGIDGSGTEVFFTPVQAALTPPLVGGVNAGFYRPDSYLALVFLTDAEDQSRLSASDFYKFLLNLKKAMRIKSLLTAFISLPTFPPVRALVSRFP
jgi:hypothetical protein